MAPTDIEIPQPGDACETSNCHSLARMSHVAYPTTRRGRTPSCVHQRVENQTYLSCICD
jgi:hypothetical protein